MRAAAPLPRIRYLRPLRNGLTLEETDNGSETAQRVRALRENESIRDQGQADQSRQGYRQDVCRYIAQCRSGQSQLGGDDAARGVLPSGSVRDCRMQADDGSSRSRWNGAAGWDRWA